MADRSVSVRLMADVRDFIAKTKTAEKAATDMADKTLTAAAKNKQSLDQVGRAALGLGAAFGVGAGAAIKKFADFDAAMSGVQAATHESAASMALLRDAALEAGARTAFSASEAAAGIEELAKAGVSTQAILSGGLDGALDLAAAGALGVGEAAEIAATAMTQFKLSGEAVPHIADLLAAAAGKAQGDVTDMGMALKQSGLVASQVGLSIEETTAGLAAFASAGLIGSDAGTSFKTMLQSLTPSSDKAAEAMADIGFSAYDAEGNFIGLAAVAESLKQGLSGLSVEQQNATLKTIFGSDAVRAAAVLYEQGAEGVAEWTRAVSDSGYAQETAATRLDNLKGDVEAFSGALETALIQSGSAGNDLARGAVQAATEIVNAYNKMPASLQGAVTAFAALGGVAATVGGGLLLMLPRIAETRTALKALNTEMPRTTAAMRGLGRAAAGLAVLTTVAISLDQLSRAFSDAPAGVNQAEEALRRFTQTGKGLDSIFEGNRGAVNSFGEALKRVTDKNAIQTAGDAFAGLFGQTTIKAREAKDDLNSVDQALSQMVSSGNIEGAAAAYERLADEAREVGLSSVELMEVTPQYQDALAGVRNEAEAAASAQSELEKALAQLPEGMDPATRAIEEQALAVKELSDAFDQIISGAFGVQESQDAYQQSLADLRDQVKAAKEEGDKHATSLKGQSQAARDNRDAVRDVVRRATDLVQAWADSGIAADDLAGKVQGQKKKLQDALVQMGFNRGEARKYSDVLDSIKAQVQTTFTTPGLTGAQSELSEYQRLLNQVDGRKVTSVFEVIRRENVPAALRPPGRADGGPVVGPGGPRDDNILIAASNGEFVVNAASTKKHRRLIEAINADRYADGGIVGFADGGQVNIPLRAFYSDYVSRWGGSVDMADIRAAEKERAAQRKERDQARRELAQARKELAKVRADDKATKAERQRAYRAERQALRDLNKEQRDLNKANRELTSIRSRYSNQRQYLRNFKSGLSAGVKDGAAFVRNLETLTKRGYGGFAQQLAQMNDDDAEQIAAQAAKASNKSLVQIEKDIASAAANEKRIAEIAAGTTPSPVASPATTVGLSSLPSYGHTGYVPATVAGGISVTQREVPTHVTVVDAGGAIVATMKVVANNVVDSRNAESGSYVAAQLPH